MLPQNPKALIESLGFESPFIQWLPRSVVCKDSNAHTVFQQRLQNGVVLISESVKTVKTVAIGFWFLCGSRYEGAKERGISHFTEHMLFKGTQKRSAYDIAVAFDRIGGYVNAFTEREHVCLHCVVSAIHTNSALEVLCDMIENSIFSDEEINRERMVIESEIISSQDDPEEAAHDAASEIVWPKNSISTPILGSKNTIKKLTREKLFNWYTDYFVTGNLTVTIAGNIDHTVVYTALEKLGNHRCDVPPRVKTSSIPNWKAGVHFIEADFQQEQLFVLYPLQFPFTQTEYYSWLILNALIGDTMSSRLFQALRERGGCCYNVYSFLSLYTDCGYWCAYASSTKKNTALVIKNIQKELLAVLKEGFTDNEITAAKEHICGEEIINSEDMEQRMKSLARNWYMDFSQYTPEQTIEAIRAVSKQNLIDVLTHLLDSKNESLLVYGPPLSTQAKKRLVI